MPNDSTGAAGGCNDSDDTASRAKLCTEAIWLSLCKCSFVATSLHTMQYGTPSRMLSQRVRYSHLRAAEASSKEQCMWVQTPRATHPEETQSCELSDRMCTQSQTPHPRPTSTTSPSATVVNIGTREGGVPSLSDKHVSASRNLFIHPPIHNHSHCLGCWRPALEPKWLQNERSLINQLLKGATGL